MYPCHFDQHLYGGRDDILSLDIYSNDQDRYLILNGSRDHTISSKLNRR
jgi:hypothetical protein